jgi:PAS domain-containing protein
MADPGGKPRGSGEGPVQDLRESEARLQGFIRHSPAAIAFKGLDGRYLLINPRMEAALGRPAEAILGRTDQDLAHAFALGDGTGQHWGLGAMQGNVELAMTEPSSLAVKG